MNKNEKGKRASEIVKTIYAAYGTDTGILFGIPSEYKGAVKVVVELVLEEEEKGEEGIREI